MKIEEKRFFENCLISNVNGLLLSDWFNPNEKDYNYLQITKFAVEMAKEMLLQRNEVFGTKEKIIKSKKETPEVDFEEIIKIFNEICFELPTVSKCTIERENSILKILENYTLENIGEVFKNVSESDFLTGKVENWKADFDWILKSENFIKILEKKYENINSNSGTKGYSASENLKEKIANRLFSEKLPKT